MKRQVLISSLVAGAALALLGGCASDYDGYGGSGYYGATYYGGGYYDPDYYGPNYYGGAYYGGGRTYVPRGVVGGTYRRHDGDHRDVRRGDNDGNRNFSRNQPQQNAQPATQAPSSGGGWRGGRDGGSQSSGFQSGGSQSGGSRSGDRPSGGPQGRFGHPGTPNNPL